MSLAPAPIRFRPSASPRFLKCPGSLLLAEQMPASPSSAAADEGTAAHYMLERAMRFVCEPEEMVGQSHIIPGKNMSWLYDDEMAEKIRWVVDFIRGMVEQDTEILPEVFVTLRPLDTDNPLCAQNGGTADVILLNYRTRQMTVCDLKYGRGVKVPADTPQLRNYALMAMLEFPHPQGWESVDTFIIQPRLQDDDEWIKHMSYTEGDLWDFAGTLMDGMVTALRPDAPLVPGSHCKDYFCPARTICPALATQAINVAASAFSATPMVPLTAATPMPSPGPAPRLPDPLTAAPEDMGAWLERRDMIKAWFEAIEHRAVKMLEAGIQIPGFTLKNRTTHRRWRSDMTEDQIITFLRQLGLQVAAITTDPKLRTPAQIEKIAAKSTLPQIAQLWERPVGEPVLVRASEAYPPVTNVFSAIEASKRLVST